MEYPEGRDFSTAGSSRMWCRAGVGFCLLNAMFLIIAGVAWRKFSEASDSFSYAAGDLDELQRSKIEQQHEQIVNLEKAITEVEEHASQEASRTSGMHDSLDEMRGEIERLKALSSSYKDPDEAAKAIASIGAENAALRAVQKELEEDKAAQEKKMQTVKSETEQIQKQRLDLEKQLLDADKAKQTQGQTNSVEDKFSGIPMVDVIGLEAVEGAWYGRKAWWRGIITLLDEYDKKDDKTWKKYNAFGPVYDICPFGQLQSYGKGDEEKKICNMNKLIDISGGCEIFSVGSNGQWEWERTIFHQMPQCKVHTFDCTGNYPAPSDIKSRVFSYQLCIGRPERGARYKPYAELLKVAGFKKPPTYFKMDVEGFEWNVFPDMLVAGVDLPDQIGYEIHWHKLRKQLGWKKGAKTTGEIAAFGEMWFRSGYLPLHRRDNSYGAPGEATEYLMVKVSKPT